MAITTVSRAERSQRPAELPLGAAEPVRLRGVEEVDAGRPGAADRGHRRLLVHRPPVPAELPGAIGDRSHLQVASPQCHRLHSVLHAGWLALYLGSLAPGLVSRHHMVLVIHAAQPEREPDARNDSASSSPLLWRQQAAVAAPGSA